MAESELRGREKLMRERDVERETRKEKVPRWWSKRRRGWWWMAARVRDETKGGRERETRLTE